MMLSFARRAAPLGALVLVACGSTVSVGGGGGASGSAGSGGAESGHTATQGSTSTGSTTVSVGSGDTTASGGPASSSVGPTTASVTSAVASSSASTGTGGTCDSTSCDVPSKCCGDVCVHVYDDPQNCGDCGHACNTDQVCSFNQCVDSCSHTGPVCDPPGFCCGNGCCGPNQICCDVPGPGPTMGPSCVDPDPMTNTCPAGCPLCQ